MALKLADATMLKWINAVVFQDQTMISDFNIVPFLGPTELTIGYINDVTFSFASEPPLINQFTDAYMGVPSGNKFLDFTKKGNFAGNYMFFNNATLKMKLEIKGKFLIMKNPATNQFVELLDTRKIYKCSVQYNMVPFSNNSSDQSWCGLAFP